MLHEFDAVLMKLEGKIQWTVFYVPFSVKAEYGTNGRVNVLATVDGHSFAGTLLPSHNGHYMVYNAQIRQACGKDLGDSVHVTVTRDEATRSVAVPPDVEAALGQAGLLKLFLALPDYIKREEIVKITSAKGDDTRARRLERLIHSLKAKAEQ